MLADSLSIIKYYKMKTHLILKKIKRIFKDDSKPLDDIHKYWKKPADGTNRPSDYILKDERSRYLLEKIQNLGKDINILEIGCNVGRNLNYLYNNNYTDLSAVEISEAALVKFKDVFGETYNAISIYNSPVEEFFKENSNLQYDLIYTMAVLEHIHTDSDWIFEHMVKQTSKYILIIEDENSISWKHFPRNYKKIFENLGMKQIEFDDSLIAKVIHKGFVYRLFEK